MDLMSSAMGGYGRLENRWDRVMPNGSFNLVEVSNERFYIGIAVGDGQMSIKNCLSFLTSLSYLYWTLSGHTAVDWDLGQL